MHNLELNKIAAAILIAGLIGMVTGKVSDLLYHGSIVPHEDHDAKRGYTIAGAENFEAGAAGAGGAAPAAAAPVDIAVYLQTADVAAGEKYFLTKCATCHTHEKGGADKIGPHLWGVLNRGKGSIAGFGYSDAMKAVAGQKWGYDELSGFLDNPKKYMPGTIMAYVGIKKPQERANVIAYLRSQHDAPPALPEPKPVAEPEAAAPEGAQGADTAEAGKEKPDAAAKPDAKDAAKEAAEPAPAATATPKTP